MGEHCLDFLRMSLPSVEKADAIVFCDGCIGSEESFLCENIQDTDWQESGHFPYPLNKKVEVISQTYDKKDKEMNGKQRNFYLDYIKIAFPDYWCLCCDADEVVDDIEKVKEFIQTAEKGLYSPKMRHLVGDFGHEDSVVPEHFCFNRLFKISEAGEYPLREHPVLQPKDEKAKQFMLDNKDLTNLTIWHLAYAPNMFDIKKRYDSHMAKSQMHTPEYLREWYKSHLFGTFPREPINPVELPEPILKEFGIERDELYFANRGIEAKNLIDAVNWKKFFEPDSVLEVGCGLGPRVWAMDAVGMDASGFDISEYAIQNSLIPSKVWVEDIGNLTTSKPGEGYVEDEYDLVCCYDVLEHLEGEGLDKAIENLIKLSKKHILISIPFIGDSNLYKDPTHKTFKERQWWIDKIMASGKLEQLEVPSHFLFPNQQLIFRVKGAE